MTPAGPLTRPDGSPPRALVVDDEADLAQIVAGTLAREGWQVRTALDGISALAEAADFEPDVAVLDIMLPDVDGLEVLRVLRRDRPRCSVLFLSARDAVADRVHGITVGADDYVTKPFSLEEVAARVRGLARRAGVLGEDRRTLLTAGDLQMDEDAREVQRAGQPVQLTATEFELLRLFLRNPRRVLSKTQILDRVWNYDFGGNAHVVELYVSSLRKKLDVGDADPPPVIHTVRGVGYVLKPAP